MACSSKASIFFFFVVLEAGSAVALILTFVCNRLGHMSKGEKVREREKRGREPVLLDIYK